MELAQYSRNANGGWSHVSGKAPTKPDLVLYFGARSQLAERAVYAELCDRFKGAKLVGCSTGGEIIGREVYDDTVIANALSFQATPINVAAVNVADHSDSTAAGSAAAAQLPRNGLRHVFILSDGLLVNGSALIAGLRRILPNEVGISGGLAGDGDQFKETCVGANAMPARGVIAAVGFYGDRFVARTGSVGGWEPFGPERVITRASENVLYELDGQPALQLYKRYLGDEAKGLPGSALLFPLAVRPPHDEKSTVVRTIVGVDETAQSMIFAGDIPQGYVGRLMRGGYDNLVTGAEQAADAARQDLQQFAILVSCIGRKLLMGPRVCEEVEAVSALLGDSAVVSGFYSYGEIAPHAFTGKCELHNQTMTVTTLGERD